MFGPLLLVSCMSAVVALPLFVLLLGSALTETGLLYTAALVFGSIVMGRGIGVCGAGGNRARYGAGQPQTGLGGVAVPLPLSASR